MSDKKELSTVRKALDATGLKVKHVATTIGVSSGHLSSYLTGKRNLGPAAKKSLFQFLKIGDKALSQRAS